MLTHLEMLERILAGAALGAAIGYERDLHGRPVGLRTHAIVSMAAATFMVISSQFAYFQRYLPGGVLEVDGSRIAASVVSAVGFLAGGAILRTNATVQGLTTAAGMWLVTAIGMCAGAGMYVESLGVTLLGLLTLTALRRFEDKDDLERRHLAVVLGGDANGFADVVSALTQVGIRATDSRLEKRFRGRERTAIASFDLVYPKHIDAATVMSSLEGVPGVRRVVIQRRS